MIKRPEIVALGKSIRRYREALRDSEGNGISQEHFAVSIDIDRSYYGRIERGEVNVTFTLLVHITKNLRTTLKDLLASIDEQFIKTE